MKMVGKIVIFCIAVMAGVIGKDIGKVTASRVEHAEKEKKGISALEKIAETVNAKAPMMIDEETRLDKMTVGPGVRGVFHYTVINYPSADLDPAWFTQELRPSLIKSSCKKDSMIIASRGMGTMAYVYYGNDGRVVSTQNITMDDCSAMGY